MGPSKIQLLKEAIVFLALENDTIANHWNHYTYSTLAETSYSRDLRTDVYTHSQTQNPCSPCSCLLFINRAMHRIQSCDVDQAAALFDLYSYGDPRGLTTEPVFSCSFDGV